MLKGANIDTHTHTHKEQDLPFVHFRAYLSVALHRCKPSPPSRASVKLRGCDRGRGIGTSLRALTLGAQLLTYGIYRGHMGSSCWGYRRVLWDLHSGATKLYVRSFDHDPHRLKDPAIMSSAHGVVTYVLFGYLDRCGTM